LLGIGPALPIFQWEVYNRLVLVVVFCKCPLTCIVQRAFVGFVDSKNSNVQASVIHHRVFKFLGTDKEAKDLDLSRFKT
jgi:hypothetical protein